MPRNHSGRKISGSVCAFSLHSSSWLPLFHWAAVPTLTKRPTRSLYHFALDQDSGEVASAACQEASGDDQGEGETARLSGSVKYGPTR